MIRNTSPKIEIDCIGHKCPGPVIRIAREAAELGKRGGILSIRADDPAFRSDIEAWARGTSTQIIELGEGPKGVVHALIAVGDARFLAAAPKNPSTELNLDMRGSGGHASIRALAKAVDERPVGSLIRLVADEPVFAMDLNDWLLEGRAELIGLESTGETHVCVRVVEPAVEPAVTLVVANKPAAAGMVATAAVDPLVVAAAPAAAVMVTAVAPRKLCTLLVLHNDHEALLAALLVANGAAAQGMQTCLFFTFWGLNLLRGDSPDLEQPREKVGLMRRLMKWMMPKGPKRQRLGQMHFGGAGKLMLSSIMRSENILELSDLMISAQNLGVEFTACTMSMSVMGITKRDLHPYANLKFAGVATFVERANRSSISLVF